ncbi:C39 family peptidase [Paenibacillus darwinianus]
MIVVYQLRSFEESKQSNSDPRAATGEELPKIGYSAPKFSLPGLDGDTYIMPNANGRPVLLNFWASWCEPCKQEAPELVKLYETYKGKMDIYAINVTASDTVEGARAFVQEYGFEFPVLMDKTAEVAKKYGIRPIPTTFFVNSEGVIVDKVIGPLNLKSMESKFTDLLKNGGSQQAAAMKVDQAPEGADAFTVYQNGRYISDFNRFNAAVRYAKGFTDTTIYFQQYDTPVWENTALPAQAGLIDAPLIAQMPELARGCEVTSLAMLLRVAGVDGADKMKLAEEIKKDPTPYRKKNGVVYYGNPYDGFIGDIYTIDKPGYGVYHGPVKELAESYLPGQIIDMTGSELQDILYSLNRGAPVWIITNTWFSRVPDSQFQTWETPSGQVKITYREHSVLITGYDEKYIYFNDPLANVKNRKILIDSFKQAYDQMGKQAITYMKA